MAWRIHFTDPAIGLNELPVSRIFLFKDDQKAISAFATYAIIVHNNLTRFMGLAYRAGGNSFRIDQVVLG